MLLKPTNKIPVLKTAITGNRGCPQSRIRIRLKKETPRWLIREFLRIRLTPELLAGGEPVTDYHRRLAKSVGVVGIEICPDWIVNIHESADKHLVTEFMIVMDRRYDEYVLRAVYRTAGMLRGPFGDRDQVREFFRTLLLWMRSRSDLIASHKRLERRLEIVKAALEEQELINRTLTEQIGAMKTAAELSQAWDKFRIENMREAAFEV